MNKKYLNVSGEIAFRIWMFANAIDSLKKGYNREKKELVLEKAKAFLNGNFVKFNATEQERADLCRIVGELEYL